MKTIYKKILIFSGICFYCLFYVGVTQYERIYYYYHRNEWYQNLSHPKGFEKFYYNALYLPDFGLINYNESDSNKYFFIFESGWFKNKKIGDEYYDRYMKVEEIFDDNFGIVSCSDYICSGN